MHVQNLKYLACLAAGAALAASPAQADKVAEFYKGKSIKILIGFSAGGGYDAYARAITRHMGRHISGNPTFVPQNMTGAGSRRAANFLYNVAPKDGTVLGAIGQATPLDQALGQKGVKYDAKKFNWIGNAIADNNMTYAWSTAGVNSLEEAKQKGGIVCGATGATSPSVTSPQIINNLTGARLKIIRGYPGGAVINLALERGEVNCRGSNSWSSIKATQTEAMNEKKIVPLVQFGEKKSDEISKYAGRDVPLISELAKTDLDRKAIAMITAGNTIGRPMVAPPGVPAERVAALRSAFDAALKDKDFLALAKKQKMTLNPISGADLAKLVNRVVTSSDEAKARLKELLKPADVQKLKLLNIAGKLSDVGKKKMVVTDAAGKKMTLKLHKRRTKVKLAGKKAKAKDLKDDLTCKIKYVGVNSLATSVNCN